MEMAEKADVCADLWQIAVLSTEPESGCVSIDALVQCMSQNEAFLSEALAKEEEAPAAASIEPVAPPQDLGQDS